jgi:Fic family protein
MYAFRLASGIRADLERIEELRRGLDRGRVLPRRWLGRLRRDLEAESIAASTAMEGVPVTVEEVRRILAGDRPANVAESDARLVEGYRDAMSYVLRRADDDAFVWQAELMLGIHDRVMAGSFAQGAGRFRNKQAHLAVSGTWQLVYQPPEPEQVPRLVEELASFAQRRQADLAAPVLAALMHVRLAGVHPFADGNGRTARVLASLVMHRGGYTRPEFTSLEEWWGSHRADYYAAFDCLGDRWKSNADVTPFIAAHVRAQRQQIDALSLRQDVERQIWTILEDIATEDLGAPPRLADALYDAFFGRSVTNRYYREIADVSMATATNDLARLSAAGLLSSRGGGRSTEYMGTEALIDRVMATAEPRGPEPSAGASVDQRRAAVIRGLAARVARTP